MKMKTHYYFLKKMLKTEPFANCLGKFEQWVLLLGVSILDYSPSRFFHPHYYLKSRDYTVATLNRLANKQCWCVMDVFHAGKQIHYLMDYFCAVHQEQGLKNPRQHMEYEKALHGFFLNSDLEVYRQEFEACPDRNNWVDDLHDRYMQQEDGFGKDLRYSIISCKRVLYTVMEKLMYERVDVVYRTKVEFKGNQYI